MKTNIYVLSQLIEEYTWERWVVAEGTFKVANVDKLIKKLEDSNIREGDYDKPGGSVWQYESRTDFISVNLFTWVSDDTDWDEAEVEADKIYEQFIANIKDCLA